MGVIDAAKDVLELVQKSDNIDLLRTMTALQQEILESVQDNAKLRAEIDVLEERLRDKRRLVYRPEERAYFDEQTGEGPFCSACFDTKHLPVRMHSRNGRHECPSCSVVVHNDELQDGLDEAARSERERTRAAVAEQKKRKRSSVISLS